MPPWLCCVEPKCSSHFGVRSKLHWLQLHSPLLHARPDLTDKWTTLRVELHDQILWNITAILPHVLLVYKTILHLVNILIYIKTMHASSVLDKITGSSWSLTFKSRSSFSLLIYFWGVPLCIRSKGVSKKPDVFTFSCSLFLFSLLLMECDCMFQRGPSLCRSLLHTVCCCPHHEAFVYIPPSKNRAPLWQHRLKLTCDMPERLLGRCVASYLLYPLFLSISSTLFSRFLLVWSLLSFLQFTFLFTPPSHCLRLAHDCCSKNATDTW